MSKRYFLPNNHKPGTHFATELFILHENGQLYSRLKSGVVVNSYDEFSYLTSSFLKDVSEGFLREISKEELVLL